MRLPIVLTPSLARHTNDHHSAWHVNHCTMYIDSRITTTPTTMGFVAEIERAIHHLKVDRDTWEALALKYKAAFEAQTQRLQELQDVCFATQAELENERAQHRLPHAALDEIEKQRLEALDGNKIPQCASCYGTAVIYSPRKRRSSDGRANPLFDVVHHCLHQHKYNTALAEVGRLLHGPLSPKTRTEGLLLKSDILRAIGPNELYDALAACSEALELCDRLSGLEAFLPSIHYQRGLLYYDLHLHRPTLGATGGVSDIHLEYGERVARTRSTTRRSGFDENRTINEELLAKIEVMGTQTRQTSAHFRQRAAARAKRMSLPHRWTSPRGE
ncbi:hypothetical protein J1614_000966 [Plenodomus biglobosus]|nr:hypothetical protein J1614_000966 [Plenodomus biglobosus]